ncbi:hypothetical protein FOA52_007245 [Chlamydomonas sp. UWO 241]|nr:hypothetical protein FOA52_007245 [Chlamydomonas sp. UWO 241]
MTEEGVSSAFVNAHGYVHDMATFSAVRGVSHQGRPETEHSWFPGYAWTIANCRTCRDHLGWRFDASVPGLVPARFWGLRRPALVTGEPHGTGGGGDDGGGEDEGEEGDGDEGEEDEGTEAGEEEEAEEGDSDGEGDEGWEEEDDEGAGRGAGVRAFLTRLLTQHQVVPGAGVG